MARGSRYKFWQNFRIAILVAVCSVSIGGCAKGVGKVGIMWEYVPDSYQSGTQPLVDKRVTIPPFTDGRPEKKKDATTLHMMDVLSLR